MLDLFDSVLEGERGIHIKSSVGRGGYIMDVLFENIKTNPGIAYGVGNDGVPLIKENNLVPLVSNLKFRNISGSGGCRYAKIVHKRCLVC